MKKAVFVLAIYQIAFGLLGIVLFVIGSFEDGLNLIYAFALLLFTISVSAGCLLFWKKSHFAGVLLSMLNQLFQSFLFIMGSVWYTFQAGLALGFSVHKFHHNQWTGSSTSFLFNIGANFSLFFNDQNRDFFLGVNFVAIAIFVFLIVYLVKRKKSPLTVEKELT